MLLYPGKTSENYFQLYLNMISQIYCGLLWKDAYIHKFLPGRCEHHQEDEGRGDDDVDDEVNHQDKDPQDVSWGISLQFFVVWEYVAVPGHVTHPWRVAPGEK